MEKKLFEDFKELSAKGVKVKEWWFHTSGKQIMAELYPGVEFKISNRWFDRFKARYEISLRRPTNAAQKQPGSLRSSIQQFHRYLRRAATIKAKELGTHHTSLHSSWEPRDIANMDQTPLQFCFNTKRATYAETGEKTIWTRTTGEGHNKRQWTVQLILLADGEPRSKPLLIFKGTGQKIPEKVTKNSTTHAWRSDVRRTRGAIKTWRSSGWETCGTRQTFSGSSDPVWSRVTHTNDVWRM